MNIRRNVVLRRQYIPFFKIKSTDINLLSLTLLTALSDKMGDLADLAVNQTPPSEE